jgi:hypothetical protein
MVRGWSHAGGEVVADVEILALEIAAKKLEGTGAGVGILPRKKIGAQVVIPRLRLSF